eukprot:TRINITY_DN577_c0_g1_i1.p1 TRINITY_DN577_c0_g1~~TRINITY_DN577_c0_g1_i1.p1  ORF type:complete len:272 (+),score=44.06 TRINITY_DN577_c0_g1_i1:208-1023(+)
MVGEFLTRGLTMVFGYAYPAYDCFKTVEKNKPEIEQLRFWCQYWILVAVLTIFERVGDTFISWLPMYSEAKLAFFVYLWCPQTKGTTYVYDTFFRPYVAKHETEIDRNLLELRTRAGDIAVLYGQKAANYAQTRVLEILQYVASQSSNSRPPRPAQQQQQQSSGVRQPPPAASTRQPATQKPQEPTARPPTELPAQEGVPSQAATTHVQMTLPTQAAESTSSHSVPNEGEAMEVEAANGNSNPPPQEIIMEEAVGATGAKLRNRRSKAANR